MRVVYNDILYLQLFLGNIVYKHYIKDTFLFAFMYLFGTGFGDISFE